MKLNKEDLKKAAIISAEIVTVGYGLELGREIYHEVDDLTNWAIDKAAKGCKLIGEKISKVFKKKEAQ